MVFITLKWQQSPFSLSLDHHGHHNENACAIRETIKISSAVEIIMMEGIHKTLEINLV